MEFDTDFGIISKESIKQHCSFDSCIDNLMPTSFILFFFFLQMNTQLKRKTSETRQKTDTLDLFHFQKKLKDKIQLFEKEKEMEGGVMSKVKNKWNLSLWVP